MTCPEPEPCPPPPPPPKEEKPAPVAGAACPFDKRVGLRQTLIADDAERRAAGASAKARTANAPKLCDNCLDWHALYTAGDAFAVLRSVVLNLFPLLYRRRSCSRAGVLRPEQDPEDRHRHARHQSGAEVCLRGFMRSGVAHALGSLSAAPITAATGSALRTTTAARSRGPTSFCRTSSCAGAFVCLCLLSVPLSLRDISVSTAIY